MDLEDQPTAEGPLDSLFPSAAPPGLEAAVTAEPGNDQPGLIGRVPAVMPEAPSPEVPISVGEQEPSPMHETEPEMPSLDPITASYYEPATDEGFRSHRRQLQQQETMSFGPIRQRHPRVNPLPPSSSDGQAPPPLPESEDETHYSFEMEDLDSNAPPPGWKFEDGYVVLEDKDKDHWEIKAGCLIRHHVIPRRTFFDPRSLLHRERQ